jgi:hypothetical protein
MAGIQERSRGEDQHWRLEMCLVEHVSHRATRHCKERSSSKPIKETSDELRRDVLSYRAWYEPYQK